MFRSRRRVEPDVIVEDVAGRLREVLAIPGPEDERIGHHQTHAGNTDPSKRGLAVGPRPRMAVPILHQLLRWRACGR